MDLNVRPYDNHQPLLLPPALGDYLPEDHLARVVDEVVDQIDLSPLYQKISPVGNPSYHPALLTKIWFYGYATQACSSRKIAQKLLTDVAFIFLAGMQKPDFRTISDFRKNNSKELEKLFKEIVRICHHLGMTALGRISLDSRIMKANASVAKSYDEKKLLQEEERIAQKITDYLRKASEIDAREDKQFGPDRRGDELPEEIATSKKRLNKLQEVKAQLKQARQLLQNNGGRKVNLTDQDARIQDGKGRKYPGYRVQVGVDAREQVIVAQDVTNEQCDTGQLIPMTDQIIQNVKELKKVNESMPEGKSLNIQLNADSSYSSLANLGKLQERPEIDPYIPDQESEAQKNGHQSREGREFHKGKFVFHPERNCYVCPVGKELKLIKRGRGRGGEIARIYRCSECYACPHFGICTTSKRGRAIKIFEHEHLKNHMREKLATPEGKKIYSLRKTTVEPALGNLAQNLGFREFLLRGLRKIRGEFALMCIAHNLVKIARHLRRNQLVLAESLT